jgi:hypothetical protein
VRYVIIGAFAAVAQQAPDTSHMRHRPDPEASQENLARLSPALKELGAWIRTEAVPEGLPFSHRQIAPGHVRYGQRSGGAGRLRWLHQTMNRCRYRLTAVSVSVLTLPS